MRTFNLHSILLKKSHQTCYLHYKSSVSRIEFHLDLKQTAEFHDMRRKQFQSFNKEIISLESVPICITMLFKINRSIALEASNTI